MTKFIMAAFSALTVSSTAFAASGYAEFFGEIDEIWESGKICRETSETRNFLSMYKKLQSDESEDRESDVEVGRNNPDTVTLSRSKRSYTYSCTMYKTSPCISVSCALVPL